MIRVKIAPQGASTGTLEEVLQAVHYETTGEVANFVVGQEDDRTLTISATVRTGPKANDYKVVV
jgi:hypothetical protein